MYEMIDLFSGIGGLRMGFETTGRVRNVLSCEIDPYARKTYETNFKEVPFEDIRELKSEDIPTYDILAAGFPCQAFSISGKRRGFEDTRGTLFFEVARIIRDTQPKAFLLENVQGLTNHDGGRTFEVIISTLKELEYSVHFKLLSAMDFGLPQKRTRIFIVGFRKDIDDSNFKFPEGFPLELKMGDLKETEEVSNQFYLSERAWNTLKAHRARHEAKGNGFGYEIIPDDGIANTLVVGGMGRERNLLVDENLTDWVVKNKNKGELNKEYIRYMTPRECARLQGFPDSFEIPCSITQSYKQFGNSVAIPVIRSIANEILSAL